MSSSKIAKYLLGDTNKDYGLAVFDQSSAVTKNILKAKEAICADFYKISWVRQGEGTVEIEGIRYEVRPNTIFIVQPNQVSKIHMLNDQQGTTVFFTEDFLYGAYKSENILLRYNLLDKSYLKPHFQIEESAIPDIELLFSKLKQESSRPSTSFEHQKVHLLLLQLLLIAINRYTVDAEVDPERVWDLNDDLMGRFRKLLELHFHEKWTLYQYASEHSVSEAQLYKVLKNKTGKTPNQIVAERRIVEAKRLLAYTCKTISEIAYAIGMMDQSNFHKYFLKHTGMTPSGYRKKVHANRLSDEDSATT